MTAILEALERVKSTLQEEIKSIKQEFSGVKEEICNLRQEITPKVLELEEKIEKLDTKVNNQEMKSNKLDRELRKRNILLYGIEETSGQEKQEDLYRRILELFNKTMRVSVSIEELDQINRTGPRIAGKNRPVLVKFLTFRKTLEIFKNRKNLKETNITIYEDLPKEIINERRTLIPIMKKFREQNKYSIIKYNNLYVDGKEVPKEDIEKLYQEFNIKKRQFSEDSETTISLPKQAKKGITKRRGSTSRPRLPSTSNNNKEAKESILNFFDTQTKKPAIIPSTSNIA